MVLIELVPLKSSTPIMHSQLAIYDHWDVGAKSHVICFIWSYARVPLVCKKEIIMLSFTYRLLMHKFSCWKNCVQEGFDPPFYFHEGHVWTLGATACVGQVTWKISDSLGVNENWQTYLPALYDGITKSCSISPSPYLFRSEHSAHVSNSLNWNIGKD